MRWSTAPKENIDLKKLSFTGNLPTGQLRIKELLNYFRYIIADELIAYIVSESNIYTSQIGSNKPLQLRREELEQFIGILFVTSIVKV